MSRVYLAMMMQTLNQLRQSFISSMLSLATVTGLSLTIVIGLANDSVAQTPIREGKSQFILLEQMSNTEVTVISSGVLADLEDDSAFDGDFEYIFDSAAAILENYTPVVRGGHFPENEGIPLEQQVTVDEAVYRVFRLDNGNELMLYRSPVEDTSRYFIRQN